MRLLDSWHAHTMDTVLPRIHSSNSAYERIGGVGEGGRKVEEEKEQEERRKKGREEEKTRIYELVCKH